ncbi:MAG: arylsulfatase [Thermogutta sp.]
MRGSAIRCYRCTGANWYHLHLSLLLLAIMLAGGSIFGQSAISPPNCVFQPEKKWSSTPAVFISQLAPAATQSRAMLTSHAQPATRRPNIVIILADDMGYSDLGCYGGEIETPHLDQLAANGLRFTQCYNTARCWPSRGTIMTGYYAQQIRRDAVPGVPSGGRGTRPGWAPLLSEVLKQHGYRCYHSGKWHIDSQPWNTGFDHGYVINDHDRFFTPKNHVEDGTPLPQPKPEDNFYLTTKIGEFAIKYLKEHGEQYSDQPFFLYLCFTSPHFPLHAPQEVIARYLERYRVGWNVIQQQRGQRLIQMGLVHNHPPAMELQLGPPYHFPEALKTLGPNEVNRPFPWDQLSQEQQAFQATKMAIHAAMVHIMDQAIGEVVAQLKAMNALDNTLIMFASDNGASAEIMVRGDGHDPNAPLGSAATFLCLGPGWSSASNTPFRRHKTWVHEGGISTPLIVHWPERIKTIGELRHTPVHFIDVFPTVLEVAGIEPPQEWNGQPRPPLPGLSFAPLFDRDGAIAHDQIWFLHEGNRAIRAGDWKLVAARDEPWELYNLAEDRGETHNLILQNPEKAKELEELWNRLWEQFQADAKRDLPPDQDNRQPKARPQRQAINQ